MTHPLRSTWLTLLLRSVRNPSVWLGTLALVLGTSRLASAAELNVVRSLDVSKSGADTVVAIAGSKAPVFTVFRLDAPPRVVVDLASADLSAVQGTLAGQGQVKQVSAAQFADGKASVGRVVIALSEHARYDVKANGDQVVVRVTDAAATEGEHASALPAAPTPTPTPTPSPAQTSAPAPAPTPIAAPVAVATTAVSQTTKPVADAVAQAENKADAKLDAQPEKKADEKPAEEKPAVAMVTATPAAPSTDAPAAVPADQDSADSHVVTHRVDEKNVEHLASKVTSARLVQHGKALKLEVNTDGEVGTYEVTELRDPVRLAIDLKGVKKVGKLHVQPQGLVRDVRAGKQLDGLRLVVDADALPAGSYSLERTSHGLTVTFGKGNKKSVAENGKTPSESPAVEVAEVQAPQPTAAESAVVVTGKQFKVRDVSFKGDEQKGDVLVATGTSAVSYELSHPDAHTAVLTLHHADLPRDLERSLDTSAFGGPVRMVSSFAEKGQPGDVQIVATLDGETKDEVKASAKGLRWSFVASDEAEMSIDGVKVDLSDTRALGLQAEAPAYALSGAPRKPKYTGRRVSFEFKDIDIHNLLRIIAEVSKKNIIVGDDVTGKITIRLRNVPWDQALDVILKTKGLDKDESGNIIRVMKADALAAERKNEAERREQIQNQEEPKLRLISVNYADASEVSERIKDVLSKKGSVTVDKRTNVLIVKDTVASLTRVEGLVRNLDLQTPQVLIEARIVEANSTFAHEIGVQWGGQVAFAPAFGNPTGLVFPSTAVVTGGSSPATQFPGQPAIPNYAVDLPAAVGTGNGGGLGFIFGSAGGAATLNLRISALENSGSAKTISAPKVTTLDNNTATISQGVAIPFSQFSASGVNTTFIEAKLELKVLPHVTQDGSVVLKIDATNNQPNPGFTGANGQPSITKKEAHTQVLVKDGDTTVIGGIYTRATGQNENVVPVLGHIPVLGYFFRHRSDSDTRTELLIFITPHIVNRQQAILASSTQGNSAPNP